MMFVAVAINSCFQKKKKKETKARLVVVIQKRIFFLSLVFLDFTY